MVDGDGSTENRLTHDIIVMGASAGGVEAISQVVAALPPDLPAALFVVMHVPDNAASALPAILNRKETLLASHATDGEAIEHGRVYIAPPGQHMLIKNGHVRLTRGPRENGHRPAVDPLFRTAARTYRARVVGVILSGNLDDGTLGLMIIKSMGGVTIAQDPDEALFPSMPRSAIENVKVDHVLPASEIASKIMRLAHEPVNLAEEVAMDANAEMNHDPAELDREALERIRQTGAPSSFSCPQCGGVLREVAEGDPLHFVCRVGHAYSPDSLESAASGKLEEALWAALRALEETQEIRRRMAARASRRNDTVTAKRFEQHADEARQRADVLRRILVEDWDKVAASLAHVSTRTGEADSGLVTGVEAQDD